jgi:FAD/FMN-containing dehydrogenase/Fe-S oxidoreductase
MSTADSDAPGRALQHALRAEGFEGESAVDEYTRHLYSRDASMYAITPLGVAFPRHAGDIAAAVRAAAECGTTVTARGAGTSLAGQTVGAGLVLDLSRHLDRITALDPEARTARVQPGVVQDQLNRAAAAHGLAFGPDTSTSNRATLGGMIGNNSAGSGSLRHGMTIDHLLALDAVLADGSQVRLAPIGAEDRARRAASATLDGRIHRELPALAEARADAIAAGYPEHWRRAGGYRLDRIAADAAAGRPFDPARFLAGSEGTLALVAEATVRLVPRPAHTVIAVGHFTSVPAALEATGDALDCAPSAVELMDRTILELARSKIEYASLGELLHGDPEALLFVTLTGEESGELQARLGRLTDLWRRHQHGYHTLTAATAADQGALLKVRKSSLGLLMAAGHGTRRPLAFVEDTAVPPEHLAEYTRRFRKILDRNGMRAGFYGHASVGCLHIRPFVDLAEPGQVAAMRAVAEEIRDLAAEYGGANSSEHGDGLARSEFNRQLFGDDLYEAMRAVKRLFDPDGRLNPGKIVDAPPMTEHLRDPALPPAPGLRTRLSFADSGGMRSAADRCMNIGLCRKDEQGVMCPSYMATRDERHATRGRAGALVKALSAADPAAALGGDELHDVLDLCLMCKACASECPLGVDMSALKAETLAHRHDTHGTPLRSRAFAAIRALNRLGSATAPLPGLAQRLPGARKLTDHLLGIAADRPLPLPVRDNLLRRLRRRPGPLPGPLPGSGPPLGTVTFLADSFTTYTEPDVGSAAIELLELAGWRVAVESGGCCGRADYSKGLLDSAAAKSADLARRLTAAAPAGPITGCEPSCLLTLRDEHRKLHPEDPTVRSAAERVRQAEELVTEAIDAGRLRLRADNPYAGRRILYHGHCHQKAEVGTAATMELLRRIPGAEVVELDAGCCGMAGSFGFESEHYALSLDIARDRLVPAIEAEPESTVLAATGVSCRQQIPHTTTREARHPLQLIRDCVALPSPTT